jgi:hypothetical protein
MANVLITNVMHYTGTGALPVLLREKMHAVCHDASFENEDASPRPYCSLQEKLEDQLG